MANLTTTSDLLNDALQKAGELQSAASPYYSLGLTYLNNAYKDVIAGTSIFIPDMGEPFVWAKAQNPGTFVLNPPYATGGVSINNNATAGSFSVPPADSMKGRFLCVTGYPELYQITEHAAGQAGFTLDTPYTEASQNTAPFKAHQTDYVLNVPAPGISRLIEPFKVDRPQTFEGDGEGLIYGIAPDVFARNFPRYVLNNGVPTRFCVIAETDGAYTVRFNKSVDIATRVEFEFIPVADELTVSPDTTPIFPRDDRTFLSYATAFMIMTDKSDSRADAYFRLAQSKLQAMVSQRKKEFAKTGSKMFGRLIPRGEQSTVILLRSASGLRF